MESDTGQPDSSNCPICILPSPTQPATSCATFPGNQSTYLLLVGDPGLNGHNAHDLFNLAAQTQANYLQTQGNNVIACRVSSVQDIYYAATKNGDISEGIYYFGHSGWRQVFINNSPASQTTNLFVGEQSGDFTNVDALNVSYLNPIQTANSGQNYLGQNASMTINGCFAGSTAYDTSIHARTSIAQLISNNIGRGVYAYDGGMYFSTLDAVHDPHQNAGNRIQVGAIPMYMVPDGAPGRKPKPLGFTPH